MHDIDLPDFARHYIDDRQGHVVVIDVNDAYPHYLKEMKGAGVELALGVPFDGKATALAVEVARYMVSADCKMAVQEATESQVGITVRLVDGSGRRRFALRRFEDGADPDQLRADLRNRGRDCLRAVIARRRNRPVKDPFDAWTRPAFWT